MCGMMWIGAFAVAKATTWRGERWRWERRRIQEVDDLVMMSNQCHAAAGGCHVFWVEPFTDFEAGRGRFRALKCGRGTEPSYSL